MPKLFKQEFGNCWFHALVNGFLANEKGTLYLTYSARYFFGMPPLSNSAVCPNRMTMSFFWRYVIHRLRDTWKTLSNNRLHKTRLAMSAIQNVPKLKNINNFGASNENYKNFYMDIFGSEYSKTIYVKIVGDLKVSKQVVLRGKPLTLNHCLISLHGGIEGKSGHAICGYIGDDKKYYVLDSSENKPHEVNWKLKSKLSEYITEHYKGRYVLNKVFLVYLGDLAAIENSPTRNEKLKLSKSEKEFIRNFPPKRSSEVRLIKDHSSNYYKKFQEYLKYKNVINNYKSMYNSIILNSNANANVLSENINNNPPLVRNFIEKLKRNVSTRRTRLLKFSRLKIS